MEGYNQPRSEGFGVDEGQWYNEAVTSRDSRRALCRIPADKVPNGQATELPEDVASQAYMQYDQAIPIFSF